MKVVHAVDVATGKRREAGRGASGVVGVTIASVTLPSQAAA